MGNTTSNCVITRPFCPSRAQSSSLLSRVTWGHLLERIAKTTSNWKMRERNREWRPGEGDGRKIRGEGVDIPFLVSNDAKD